MKKIAKGNTKTTKVHNTGSNFNNIWSSMKTTQSEKKKEKDFSWTGGQKTVWEIEINGEGHSKQEVIPGAGKELRSRT